MGVTWNATYEAEPADSDLAGAVAPPMRALKLALENALKLLVEDTSGNAVGASADMDSLRIKRSLVDDSTIEWSGNQLQVKANGIVTAKMADGAIGAGNLGDAASYENAQSRYISPSLIGSWDVGLMVEPDKITFPSGTIYQMYVPLDLPHGVTITELRATLESDGAQDLIVNLERGPLADETKQAMAQATTTSGTKTTSTDSSISYAEIDNSTYKYWLLIQTGGAPSSDVYVYGVRIKYTTKVPLK